MAQRPRTSPKKQARQDRSRFMVDTIVESTARVLVKEGYERATTNRIAETAGVSVGSLYQYFPSKDALLAELIGRNQQAMLLELQQSLAAAPDLSLPSVIRSAVGAHLRYHAKNPQLHRILVEHLPRVARLQSNIKTRQQTGELVRMFLGQFSAELRVVDVSLASFIIVSLIDTLTQVALLERTEALTDPAFEEEVINLVLRYLLKGWDR